MRDVAATVARSGLIGLVEVVLALQSRRAGSAGPEPRVNGSAEM